MSETFEKRKQLLPIVIVQIVVLLLIVFLSIIPVDTWNEFRWMKIGGVVPYFLYGSVVLFIFGLVLTFSAFRSRNRNMIMFIVAIFIASILFLWSTIIDSSVTNQTYSKLDHIHHDGVWFPLAAIFVIFLYLHLEFQYSESPPLIRTIIVTFGVAPAFVTGLASLAEGANYISGDNFISFVSSTLLWVFGFIFTNVFGAISYYKSLDNIYDEDLILPSQLQFLALFGITETLVIFAINNLINNLLRIEFNIYLIVFLSPLIYLYARRPSYLTTLTTPIHEIFVIEESGLPLFSHKFNLNANVDHDKDILRGGFMSAITTLFNEILETPSIVNNIAFQDKMMLIRKIPISEGKFWIVGLISTNTSAYLQNSLSHFTKYLDKANLASFESLAQDNLEPQFVLPPDVLNSVKSIFY